MAGGPFGIVLRHFRRLTGGDRPDAVEPTDGQLLESFAERRDPTAMERLIDRHGGLVLGVCRRLLGDRPEVDDAFQAAFLVLVRKAGTLQRHGSLGPWLYTVSYRLALRLRTKAARRPVLETIESPDRHPDPLQELTARELCDRLDEELQRLPEKYRAPLVLCCLEGLSRDEAARQLGWSAGAVKGRLERGRELLRSRLAQHGIALSLALFTSSLAAPPAKALTEMLRQTTLSSLVGQALPSPEAEELAREVLRAMFLSKLQTVTGAVLIGCVVLGLGLFLGTFLDARPAMPPREPQAPSAEARPPQLKDRHGDLLPAGAVARMGTDRWRHNHTVSAVAFSADGQLLATACWDSIVRLWDVADGREKARFVGHKEGLSSVALSPDGKLLASGGMDKVLALWDVATGRELQRTGLLENTVIGLAFSPDGKRLASVSGEKVRLWDVRDWKEARQITVPKPGLRRVVFTPDGKELVGGCQDGVARVWDAATGEERRRFEGHTDFLYGLAVSPDGKLLATAAADKDRSVRLWDLATGQELHRLPGPAGWVRPVTFSPDSKLLATGGQDGKVRLYDPATGKELRQLVIPGQDDVWGPWVMALAFSPDGKTLASSGTERALRLWDVAAGVEIKPLPGHQNEVKAVAFASDGRSLVSVGEDGLSYFWEPATGNELKRLTTHRHSAPALHLAEDGRFLLWGEEKTVRLWDLAVGKKVREWQAQTSVGSGLALSRDGTLVAAAAAQEKSITLYDAATGAVKKTLKLPGMNGHHVPMTFSPDGVRLATGTADRVDAAVLLWDVRSGEQIAVLEVPDVRGDSVRFAPDGRTLALSVGSAVLLFDAATGKPRGELRADKDTGSCLAFSPDGRVLASGGGPDQPTVRLWDLATGQLFAKVEGHRGWIKSVAFSPDGRYVASASEDTTVLIWDTANLNRAPRATDREVLWKDLGAADAAVARQAVWGLALTPEQSVAFLAERLRPTAGADPQLTARLVADLDSESFESRQQAVRDLEKLGEAARPALTTALKSGLSAEGRKRVEGLLEKLQRLDDNPEALREVRAVEVLERSATPEARRLLERLAAGLPDACLTGEARAAINRLTR